MKKKTLLWNLKKELTVYEGDLKLLEKIQANYDKVEDYDGKTVNKYLENRIKKIDDSLYLKEKWSGASEESYTIDCFNKYHFETNHGHEISDTTIIFYLNSPEGKFSFENFKLTIDNKIEKYVKKVLAIREAIENLDDIINRYNEIYKSILDFKKDNKHIKNHFTKFSTFYDI